MHHAINEITRPRIVEVSEAQGVHKGDGTCPHRKDVAHNPSDTGGRSVEWFDEGRVIVRLDLPRHRNAWRHLDDAGPLPRAHDDPRPFRGQ